MAIAGFASDLRAQDATADQGAGLEEVVVTARESRDESLLEVPVSVTAFTSKKIESEGIIDLKGIADFTPGFVIGNTGSEAGAEGGSHADRSTQNLDIRGVFNRASVFIDGAPIADGIVDVSTIWPASKSSKVRRAPISCRATFIGAVNLVTKDPGDPVWRQLSGLVRLV